MPKLIYTATTSLDGCTEDAEGNIDWGAPDQDVFAFINDRLRPIGTYLFGRRMYETMVYWETPDRPNQSTVESDFAAIWRVADKVVYSTTLEAVSSARTRIERDFDPEAVRRMKATSTRDISVGGSELAAEAIEAGLVDELQLFVVPVVLGGRRRWFPADGRLKLELLVECRFDSGRVFLHYRVVPAAAAHPA